MKKIFTLFAAFLCLVVNNRSWSQTINEHFENDSLVLAANCWQFVSMKFAVNPGAFSSYVISNNGSLFSDPPVSATDLRIARTPLLNVGSTIDISFVYGLSNKLTGQQTRTLSVDLVTNAGTLVQNITTIFIDNNSANNVTTTQTYSGAAIPVATAGLYRIAITVSGTNGGLGRLSIDDLTENATIAGCAANSPLPVKLTSFQGNLYAEKASLSWSVAENEFNDHFEVERSADGKAFDAAAIVFASSKPGSEQYAYAEMVNTEKVYYRLKMFDNNHSVSYSKTLMLQNKEGANDKGLSVINNPTTDKLTFSYTAPANQSIDIKVYDMAGRIRMRQTANAFQGRNMMSLQLDSNLPAGVYVVRVNNDSQPQIAKFVKQ